MIHAISKWYLPIGYLFPTFSKMVWFAPYKQIGIVFTLNNNNNTFLYYGCAIDHSILPVLNEIGANQSASTASTKAKVEYLMNYAVSHPDPTIHYAPCQQYGPTYWLRCSILVMPKACSRIVGYYLTKFSPPKPAIPKPVINGMLSNAKPSATSWYQQQSQRHVVYFIIVKMLYKSE